MFSKITKALRTTSVAAGAVVLLLIPTVALAQSPVPSYATQEQTIKGTISSFDGAYTMHVRDDRGFVDNVSLHQGTIINPTGIRLQPGFSVTILGRPNGNTFVANEIDTPYHFTPGIAYYTPAYPYAYSYPYWNVGLGWGGWGGWGGYRGGFHRW
jgi:hypothetical protein